MHDTYKLVYPQTFWILSTIFLFEMRLHQGGNQWDSFYPKLVNIECAQEHSAGKSSLEGVLCRECSFGSIWIFK